MRMYMQASVYGWYVDPDRIIQVKDDAGNDMFFGFEREHEVYWGQYSKWLAKGNKPLPPNDMGMYPAEDN